VIDDLVLLGFFTQQPLLLIVEQVLVSVVFEKSSLGLISGRSVCEYLQIDLRECRLRFFRINVAKQQLNCKTEALTFDC
jgi:hypothetical protein